MYLLGILDTISTFDLRFVSLMFCLLVWLFVCLTNLVCVYFLFWLWVVLDTSCED